MQLKQLLNDDDAVSPVIGVILMVAITVILAAVIGTFVLGLGDQVQQTAPNSNFAFDFDEDEQNLTVTHNGGDGIEAQNLVLTGDITQSGDAWATKNGYDSGEAVRAGDDMMVGNDTSLNENAMYIFSDSDPDGVDDGEEVNVVWRPEDSDRSSTLRTWERGN